MSLASKIFAGYTALIVLMVLGLAYQILIIHRLRSINEEVAAVDFQAAVVSILLGQDVELVREFTSKYLLLGDPDYRSSLRRAEDSVSAGLNTLDVLVESDSQRARLREAEGQWSAFQEALGREEASAGAGAALDRLPPEIGQNLDALDAVVTALQRANVEAIQTEAERSTELSLHAVRVSWIAALVAVVASLLIAVGIVGSVRRPMRELTAGTRALSEGKFFYRLDTSRDDEFAELARDFNAMSERLGELDRMKQDFVSHISHDLKSPLASMREGINLMLEEIPGPLNEKQRRLLTLSARSGRRLSTMIGNLLDVGRMEAGAMEYEMDEVDLAGIVRTVVDEASLAGRERSIRIEDLPPQGAQKIRADKTRIAQILHNLLDNAMKFSPEGSTIRVRVEPTGDLPAGLQPGEREKVARRQDDGVYFVVSVTDAGPGVPDTEKTRIFDKFHQTAEGKKVSRQGVGLGLSICRMIVDAHRGAIWVEDNENGSGSVFKVLLAGRAERRASEATHAVEGV